MCCCFVFGVSSYANTPWRHTTSVGLAVHLTELENTDDAPPIVVTLKRGGPNGAAELFVNARSVHWTNLDAELRRALSLRPPHAPVEIQGDAKVPWGAAVLVVDAARGLQADVVLLPGAPAHPFS